MLSLGRSLSVLLSSPSTIAGIGLWALALYLALFPQVERITGWVTQSLQPLPWAGGRALMASVAGVVPFLMLGLVLDWGVEWTLGHSWAVSMGVMACMGTGVYELGRRDGEAS